MQSLSGVFPKPRPVRNRNFIKENVRSLKLMQQQNQQNEANNEIGRQKNQRKIRSTSHSRLRSSNDLVNNIVTSKSIENIPQFDYGHNPWPLSVQSRDACNQTESVDDELFLKDVIIRLPSANISNNQSKTTEKVQCSSNRTENKCQEDQDNVDGTESEIRVTARHNETKISSREYHAEGVKFDNPTRCEQSLRICAKDNNKAIVPASYRKGEIPKYLKEMRIKEVEKNRLASIVDVNCPPGHSVLTETERLESLEIARKRYQDLINELNHMPLSAKTLRIRNRQIEIEKELRQLDNTLQIFSRSRVFVKIDE